MADVLEHGRELPPRRRLPVALVAALAAALLAGGAVVLVPRALRDEAAPTTATSPPPSPTPLITFEPVPEPILVPSPGPVTGPPANHPIGLQLFVVRGAALMRLDVDSGRLTAITGVGDVRGRSPHVRPWGRGTALFLQPPGVDPEGPAQPSAVYLIAKRSSRARQVGTAHTTIPGARTGDVVFLTYPVYDEAMTAVTYDSLGVRRATQRVPRGTWVDSWTAQGPVLRTDDAGGTRLRHPARTTTFVGRVFLGVTPTHALTTRDSCEMEPPCDLEVVDLVSGSATTLGLPDGYSAYSNDSAFSQEGDEALVYTHLSAGDPVGDLVHLDLRAGAMQPVPGASAIGAVSHLSWTGDGNGAFFESGGEWVYWSPGGGIELLRRTAGVTVVGVA
jgi:hypothetical protein